MFEELVNFRDIGGIASRLGGAVKTGSVYRAGLFSFVGQDASSELVDRHGVRTVIDLRMDHERAEHPTPPMFARHPQLRAVHLPFFEGHEFAAATMPGGFEPANWAIRYAGYTELAGRWTAVRIYEEILADQATPTVFHCWSGKDRTGLTAAMLLDLLGVDDAAIGVDYEQSMHWWLPRLDHNEISESESREGYNTVPEVIVLALENLRGRFGSVEDMLLASGMEPDLPDRLRQALLT